MPDVPSPRPPQRTASARVVLPALQALPPGQWTYAGEIAQQTGLGRGSARSTLRMLERAGWCESRDETHTEARTSGRGRLRRYYRLTAEGRAGWSG